MALQMQIIHFNSNIWRETARSPIKSSHQKTEVYLPEKFITDVQNATFYSVPVDSVLGRVTCSRTHAHYLLASTWTEVLHKLFFAMCFEVVDSILCIYAFLPQILTDGF